METIHLKTVDPISQELLRSASHRGLESSWDRFEKLQPQDGFLRLGLSCPFGCLQGPCRIDPFGRGPGRGVCGLARDEMVAGMLLRLCLQGATEAAARVPSQNSVPDLRCSPVLGELVNRALAAHGQPDLSVDDLFKSGSLLRRPSSNYRALLSQALRLCLLTLGFQEQAAPAATPEYMPGTVGYTTLASQTIRIGLTGQPSASLVAALGRATSAHESIPPVQLVALGDWIVLEEQFLPIACTSGESELLVGSGVIHLLVAGPGTEPGLISLCEDMNIPLVADADIADAADIVHRARRCLESRPQMDLFDESHPVPGYRVVMPGGIDARLAGLNEGESVAVIGGSDTPQMPLGKLPVELAADLSGQGIHLAGWGDAALWVLKEQAASQEVSSPFLPLDYQQGALLAVKALAGAGNLDRLLGVCFSGMKSCEELATALGLASLGCRVSVAMPIPVRGSQAVMDALSDMFQQNGGQLRHFDHPATTGELSEWFTGP